MSDRTLQIGDVEIVRIVDAIIDYPFPLEELYPEVPVEAWDPWRKQYPTTFATEKTHRVVYTCYVLRSAGQTILVDTGLGPAWAPMAVQKVFDCFAQNPTAGNSTRNSSERSLRHRL